VTAHAEQFRDLFENRCQFRHFQNYLTGLMVLPNKSLANLTRCTLDSADKTNLSRFFSEAPWFQDKVNDRRIRYLMEQTGSVRRPKTESALVLDDTLCEHGGSLFEHIARHYNHGDDTFPLAHNPVTSHYVSGAVRFPVDLREYRRYEELTHWEEFVHKFASLADRDLLSGWEGEPGVGRVSHAQRPSHWETLVSGVRSLLAPALGLSATHTDRRQLACQNHRGSVSPASSGSHSKADPACARQTPARAECPGGLWLFVCETTGSRGSLASCLPAIKIQQSSQ
jgi:hypothetical protein